MAPLASGQGPGGFSTNLRLWMKANAGVAGSPVSSWTDQSANASVASQATVNFRPAIVANRVNFNPAVQFDGSNDQLVIANGIVGAATYSDVNIFAVLRTNLVTASSVFLENQSGLGRLNVHVPWSDNSLYWDAGAVSASQRISTPWASSTNTNYLWSFTASTVATASGARQDIYRNGLILANDNTMTSFTGNNSNFSLGNGFGFYNGEIAEFIVYNGAITAAQLSQIHSYLAIKYGITIDQSVAQDYVASNGSVIWNSATNSLYKFDIAGIGRDDNSVLDQRKSTSINVPTDIITMANSNFAAPVAFGTDRQFLMWGNDAQTISADPTAGSFVHNGVTVLARSKRTWSTYKTGGPAGNAIVEVNMALVGGGTGANADVRLLIDNDAVFGNGSAGELTIAPTAGFPVTGGVVDFTVPYVSLAAGQAFFTLGSVNNVTLPMVLPAPGGVQVATRLWLKADAGVTGSPVSNWADQSGNGFNGTQPTAANRPAFLASRINFNPAVQFDGSNDQLVITGGVMGVASYTDFNAFAVLRTNVVSSSSVFYEDQAATGRINAHIPWSDNALYWDAGSAVAPQRLSTPWTGSINTNYVWSLTSSTTATPSGQRQDIYKNGLILANDNTMSAFTGNGSNMYIGSLSGASFLNGEIAELILYNGSFTAPQLQNVHSYLATKYGITLDQSAPQDYSASNWNGATGTKFWSSAAAGVYKNDIAAIGRDDNSTLNQKQSASLNATNVLTIGNVAIAADNASNGNTFSTDRTFFSWGHNGQALNATGASDFGTTVNSEVIKTRISRVWFGQETGTVGSVKLRFDLSTVPGVGGTAGNNDLASVRLLIDPDGVFATGATSVAPTTFSNITHIVDFDVDLTGATGYYFTIGSLNLATAPLPVELVRFQAHPSKDHVALEWITASELNNDYFMIEVSADGESWRDVAFIKGMGTTQQQSVYTTVDNEPSLGISYYRLRQVDFGGKIKYSDIERVIFEGSGVKLYPNPVVGGEISVELIGTSIASGIRITSISGSLLYNIELPSTHGKKQSIKIPVGDIAPGMYIVTIYSMDGINHTKVIIR